MPTAKELKQKVKDQDPDADWGEESADGAFPNEVPDLGEWVDFSATPVFVGRYLGTHDGTLPKADGTGMSIIHDFVDGDGVAWSIPGHVILTRKLSGLVGKEVRIEKRGTLEPTQKGRKGAEDYSVRYR